MDCLPLYILAGGKSRRFGTDKARAPLGTETLLQRVAAALCPLAARITVVARTAGTYDDLGLPTIGDLVPDRGPLGGLATALADAERCGDGPWILLAACDFPHLDPDWIPPLIQAAAQPAQAAAYRGTAWQPLPGVYHAQLGPTVSQRIEAGRLSLQGLLDTAAATALPLPANWPARSGINTPGDLRALSEN